MKNLLLVLVLACSSIVYPQSNFTVSGDVFDGEYWIDDTVEVYYLLYEVDSLGLWNQIDVVDIDSSYSLTITPATYLVVFRAGEKAKHLYLDITRPGKYTMHVNFDWTSHSVIYFNLELNLYDSYLVSDETVKDMYEQE